MNTVDVAKKINSPSALTQEQGEVIFTLVSESIQKKEIINLNFENVESMISPFLNTAFGKLYGLYSSEIINLYLKLDNFPASKKSTLAIVASNAKKYYADKASYASTVKDVIG